MSGGQARVVDVTEEEEGQRGPRTRMDKFLAFMGGEGSQRSESRSRDL